MIPRLWLAILLTACGGGQPGIEDCKNKLDDDEDGLIDCADTECASVECVEICTDGFDNNLDGAVDCDDPQCDGEGCGEICDDGRDNDDNGQVDCEDAGCLAECDKDGDGFFATAGGGDDCNDLDPAINPGAAELCDGFDNDCNGLIDREDPNIDPIGITLWYLDDDGDGFGNPVNALYACDQPPGRVDNDDDCDDEDPSANPLTPEICNGLDDNCNGLVDDQDPTVDLSGAETWYVDADGDGLGAPGTSQIACNRPAGHADNDDDCDDGDDAVLDASMWLLDGDGDGYGGGAPVGPFGCVPPGPNYYPDYLPADCEDGDGSIHPGAIDVCEDGIDQDCMGGDDSCQPDCVRLGFKFGADPTWGCPAGYRMPTTFEYSRVQACLLPQDLAYFDYYHDIATVVGGCNCKWNGAWCGQPSIETINGGRMCGDFDQLHVCVELP